MRIRAALVLLAFTAGAAQDLPPGILLLSHIKRHARANLERLPDYTCLETAQRFHRAAGPKAVMKPHDSLRLEVLYTGSRELYAAPGDVDFREDNPGAFASEGLIGGGLFASFLRTLFIHDTAMYTWRGEESLAGRRTVRYDYRVPLVLSGWTVVVEDGSGAVTMRGTIWADPESLDLVRLTVEAADIPPTLDVAAATVLLDYARMRIGDAEVILPQTGELSMMRTSGRQSRNVMEFTHCRSFQAQSTLSFGPPPTTPAESALPPRIAVPDVTVALPAGLPVTIRLAAGIGEKHGVGSGVEGIVAGSVVDKGNVLVPDGARVTGRIRRLERSEDAGGFFMVGIEFSEIRSAGAPLRFFADLVDVETRGNIDLEIVSSVSGSRATVNRITAPDLPGVGVFFVRRNRLDIPAGLRMNWKTRSLAARQ